jgi:hypothetical protein
MKLISEQLNSIMKNLSSNDVKILTENRFPYIFTKAFYFLQDGPERFSQNDAFGLPDDSFSKEDIKKIIIGSEQIMNGKGFRKELPLDGIGIRACHKLFELFHFKFIKQSAFKLNTDEFMDEMTFEHVVDKSTIKCYNVV